MNARGFFGWATVGVAWAVAACALAAAPGCGGSDAAAVAQFDKSPRETLKESLQYSQDMHKQKKSSRRGSPRR
ncbi:hypothetical protein [Planctomyces sp. SH-PL62]|uniref:hypothetical protein n=1 Tax=Planctomyces sp. SH-PL62 TaxID=1636152 RepID=UPI00078CE6B6|nr:hypothetical protein [Planctomyces sp. SH-PL62]AMV35891.1 hypothetical protein VT85_00505 [Planctomyces sp. SH-PL62]